jgi:hypothetical protein
MIRFNQVIPFPGLANVSADFADMIDFSGKIVLKRRMETRVSLFFYVHARMMNLFKLSTNLFSLSGDHYYYL